MKTINSILKNESVNPKDNNVSRALRAHADFLKMCDYCESIECRHKTFANYFGDSLTVCKKRCDVCEKPDDVKIALQIFHSLPFAPMSTVQQETHQTEPETIFTVTANGQLENHQTIRSATLNGRSIKLEQLDSGDRMETISESRPQRPPSPADTIIKGETIELHSNLGEGLTRPTRNVSPAVTIIKEELDNKDELQNMIFRPPPSVSPAETLIAVEPINMPTVIKSEPRQATPPLSIPTFIKREPMSPGRSMGPGEPETLIGQTSGSELECINESVCYSETTIQTVPTSPGVQSIITILASPSHLISTIPTIPPFINGIVIKSEPMCLEDLVNPIEPAILEETPISQETPMILETPVSPTQPISASEHISPRVPMTEEELTSPTPFHPKESIKQGLASITTSLTTATDNLAVSALSTANLTPAYGNHTGKVIKRERSVEHKTVSLSRSLSPTDTIIKDEPRSPEIATKSPQQGIKNEIISRHMPRKRSRSRSSCAEDRGQKTRLSPSRKKPYRTSEDRRSSTDTIIKDERQSPEIATNSTQYRERKEYILDTVSISSLSSRSPSPERRIKNEKKHLPDKRRRSRSKERYSRYRRESDDARSRRPRSRSKERFKYHRESEVVRVKRSRSRSKERSERKLQSRRNDSPPSSSRKGYRHNNSHKSPEQKDRRRRSNEENSRDQDELRSEHKHESRRNDTSPSSARKSYRHNDSYQSSGQKNRRRSKESDSSDLRERSQRHIKSEMKSTHRREDRNGNREGMKRNPNESSNDGYRSPLPSTSTAQKRNGNIWSGIEFPVSPELSPSHPSDTDDDYGWEDDAPPKPEPLVTTLEDIDPSLKEKIHMLNDDLKTGLDLDETMRKKKELFDAIEESIAAQSVKKLNDLDKLIQKKKDDFARQLYGTDNFDSWDDDPALSNVGMGKKLKSFKSLVPEDTPVMEKMFMKNVINVMRLTPARERNELVFHGHIKQIETEFQGKELPPYLLDSIKQEKSIIAELVIKFIMPYYNEGRIQPKELFNTVARKISHIFYDKFAGNIHSYNFWIVSFSYDLHFQTKLLSKSISTTYSRKLIL